MGRKRDGGREKIEEVWRKGEEEEKRERKCEGTERRQRIL